MDWLFELSVNGQSLDQLDEGTIATLTGGPLMLVIAGVVQVMVESGFPARYASLLSLILGWVIGVVTILTTDLSVLTGIVQGSVVGLAASGLWGIMSNKVHVEKE